MKRERVCEMKWKESETWSIDEKEVGDVVRLVDWMELGLRHHWAVGHPKRSAIFS